MITFCEGELWIIATEHLSPTAESGQLNIGTRNTSLLKRSNIHVHGKTQTHAWDTK